MMMMNDGRGEEMRGDVRGRRLYGKMWRRVARQVKENACGAERGICFFEGGRKDEVRLYISGCEGDG